MKIAFFDAKQYDRESFDRINTFGFSIKYFPSHLTEDNCSLTAGHDAVCVFVNDNITASMISMMYENGVRLIALRSAGFNNVDFKAAYGKIHVIRVPAYSPHAIAEHSLALMLTLNRNIHRAYNRTRESNFAISGLLGFDMHGKTAGVFGTGKIGKELVKILRGMGMNVLVCDPYIDKDFEQSTGCRYVTKNELLSNSDIISLNCPLTKETEYIINKDTIALMKNGVMLINTGRGKLINTKDLIQGLKTGKIGSAGLDVYEEESHFFFEDYSDRILTDDILARLLSFRNVIITSHQAFFTDEALTEIASTTLNGIESFEKGERLENEICYQCMNLGPACKKKSEGFCFK
jgi:D-lactate dehydrogenase